MNVIDELEAPLPTVGSMSGSGVPGIQRRIGSELAAWKGHTETDPEGMARLEEYWSGIDYPGWHPVDTPWSAAFVSYTLRQAGFPQRAAHYQYVKAIIDGQVPGWKAYSIPKNAASLTIHPGDVLIRARGSAGSPDEDAYYWTHGDVVYRVEDGRADLAGGNLSDSAMITKSIQVDASNRPTSSLGSYRIILKKKPGYLKWIVGAGLIGAGWYWLKK